MFHVLAGLEYPCILGVDFISGSKIVLDFDRKALAIQDSQVEDKVDEGNLRVDVSETKLNVVANVSDKNPVESIIGEKDQDLEIVEMFEVALEHDRATRS
ncbi:hypothetical protein TNCV_2542541 [Trichonephila clavipes]|nr:hypothetical protein TNCV_2542541 [Trichonephila clavipes]